MISFVALLKIDLFDIPLISLLLVWFGPHCPFPLLLHIALQAFPSEVTGNNTGLAGWAYWALSFVALIHHLYALKRIPNLYTHYIGWPSCVVSALPFTGIITYLITLFSLLLTSDTLFDIHLLFIYFCFAYLLCFACSRVFGFLHAVGGKWVWS